jgi:hypothetical protein
MLVNAKSIPDMLFRHGKRREYSEGDCGPGDLKVGLDRPLYQQHRILAQKSITNLETFP